MFALVSVLWSSGDAAKTERNGATRKSGGRRPGPPATRSETWAKGGATPTTRPGVAPPFAHVGVGWRPRPRPDGRLAVCQSPGHHVDHCRAARGAVKARRMAPTATAASALTAPRCSPDPHLRDGQEDGSHDAGRGSVPSTNQGEDDGMNDERIRNHNRGRRRAVLVARHTTPHGRCCDRHVDRGER